MATIFKSVEIYIQEILRIQLDGPRPRYAEILAIDTEEQKEKILFIPLDALNGVGAGDVRPGQTVYVDVVRVIAGHPGVFSGYEVVKYSSGWEIHQGNEYP